MGALETQIPEGYQVGVWRAECYGCDFTYHTPLKTNLPIIMGSHVFNCEEARVIMQEVFTERTHAWKFNEYNWYFKYNDGDALLYIFTNKQSLYAMCAVPLLYDRDRDLASAQDTAREWITAHNAGYSPIPARHSARTGSNSRPPAPAKKPDPAYEGSQCDMCGERDEDVLVPSPDDMMKHRCMECLIGSKRSG